MFFWIAFIVVVLVIGAATASTKNPHYNRPLRKSNSSIRLPAEPILYKVREVKRFEMKGMYYRNLTESEYLDFQGFIETEDNPHDKYAVAVYDKTGTHLGYVSRGHKRLSDSIDAWHNSKVIAWGTIHFDRYRDKWFGGVYIPIGLKDVELQNIETIFTLKERRNELLAGKDLTIETSFQILEMQQDMLSLFNSIEKPDGIFVELPPLFITRFSAELEKSKDYRSLVKLSEYDNLIQTVNGRYLNAILKRIESAKEKLVIT